MKENRKTCVLLIFTGRGDERQLWDDRWPGVAPPLQGAGLRGREGEAGGWQGRGPPVCPGAGLAGYQWLQPPELQLILWVTISEWRLFSSLSVQPLTRTWAVPTSLLPSPWPGSCWRPRDATRTPPPAASPTPARAPSPGLSPTAGRPGWGSTRTRSWQGTTGSSSALKYCHTSVVFSPSG